MSQSKSYPAAARPISSITSLLTNLPPIIGSFRLRILYAKGETYANH